MIWFFIFQGRSPACTKKRFKFLAKKLAENAQLWRVQQLFNKASDEINCYDQNIPAPLSVTRNNTSHDLNAAEQTSQQEQQRSTETSNNAVAADFRAPQSADNNNAAASSSCSRFVEEGGREGHGPEPEADRQFPVDNSPTSLALDVAALKRKI